MDIRDKVQIDAIKDSEEYSICEYGTHVLITEHMECMFRRKY